MKRTILTVITVRDDATVEPLSTAIVALARGFDSLHGGVWLDVAPTPVQARYEWILKAIASGNFDHVS